MSSCLLIDADPIVYRSGFAAERTRYEVVVEHDNGELRELSFEAEGPSDAFPDGRSAGDQLKAMLEQLGDSWTVAHKQRIAIPEERSHALHLVNQQILSIASEVERETGVRKADREMRLFLTGPGNFRDAVATIKPYKGNRDPSHKPFHYQAIRDHLQHNWGAEVVEGIEADDKVSILARAASDPVVATIDKDLDQIPGLHYDYLKKVMYVVEPDDAEWWFWRQIVLGDPTDNIGGAYRVGNKSPLLDTIRVGDWSSVVSIYQSTLDKYGAAVPYASLGAEAAALENARLVYMLRQDGEGLWTPPHAVTPRRRGRNGKARTA